MPQRSNDFQSLIKRIYEQLVPLGAVVSESAMLREVSGNETREVDVLVEFTAAAAEWPMRIAIECRDHARRSDKTWIDALAGKYRDLPVDRVIAVSRQPFTAGAVLKAQQCRIGTRTLADAMNSDWPGDLFEVDFSNVSHWPQIAEITLTAGPPWLHPEFPTKAKIGDQPVESLGLRAWLRKQMAEAFAAEARRQRTLGRAEFDQTGTHPFDVTLTNPRVPIVLYGPNGVEHHVAAVRISGSVAVDNQALPGTRYRFGTNVGVTRAQREDDRGATEVLAVQEKGKGLSVRVSRRTKK